MKRERKREREWSAMAIPGASVTARAQGRKKKPQGAFKPLSRQFKKKKKTKKTKGSHGSASATNPNFVPLGKNIVTDEWKKDKADKKKAKKAEKGRETGRDNAILLSTAPASEQLRFFLDRFEVAYGIKLSSLELEAFKDTCFVELSQDIDQGVENFSKHMKDTFGTSWKEVLYEGKLSEGKIQAGSPALLIVSTSALRSLELLRGLQSLTRDCRPAKLFAKHIKVEDQVSFLKNRVNIATGTPSRIKKLVDIDALGLSRLAVVVIDMQRDAKGYTLFTLPQVSNEFWDLHKTHFQQRLLQGDLRICFYGRTSGTELESKPNYDE